VTTGGLPFDQPPAAGGSARRVVSVSELTTALRDLVESRFHEVWVEGELSGARVWNTGHLYFTLKDARAQLKGVMFRSSLRLLRFTPEDGLRVVARGRLSVYDPRGEYQLVCEHLEPRGLGARQLAYEQLRAKLAAEGLFDDSRKRPLPALPRRIGVVTSLDGAALRDIIRVLHRRHPNAQLVVAPARVQGEAASRDLARALRQVTRIPGVDVVIVGRGGGSIEDLWAFNEEPLARAITASPVPVIAAVGHETDVTIADFVADLRAPTPSAAAELVVRRKDEFTAHLEALTRRAAAACSGRVQRLQARLHRLQARPAFAGLPARVAFRQRHVIELAAGLRRRADRAVAERRRRVELLTRALATHHPQQRLVRVRTSLTLHDRRLAATLAGRRLGWQTRLREAAAHLHALSPLAVLGRGYAMCWTDDRSTLIRTAAAVAPGDRVRVRLASGELGCDVRDVRPADDGPTA